MKLIQRRGELLRKRTNVIQRDKSDNYFPMNYFLKCIYYQLIYDKIHFLQYASLSLRIPQYFFKIHSKSRVKIRGSTYTNTYIHT